MARNRRKLMLALELVMNMITIGSHKSLVPIGVV